MSKKTRLGLVQSQILNVLWEKGEATAKEIGEELSKHEDIAHSTVQTLLRQLEAKKAVAHRAEGRTFFFRPILQRDEIAHSPLDQIVDRFYGGSLVGFVSYFIKNEKISAEELQQLKALIDEETKGGNR
jgi:BlaI family penicillinase repressor